MTFREKVLFLLLEQYKEELKNRTITLLNIQEMLNDIERIAKGEVTECCK